jgi:uncharacterized membrane protein YtjA (UPF0391 family)
MLEDDGEDANVSRRSASSDVAFAIQAVMDKTSSPAVAFERPRVRGPRNYIPLVLVPALFLLALTMQWLRNSYHGEFNGYPDEAAHYVTGLLVRDYAAAGFPSRPFAFAKDYYLHYPKVALGQWPPFFYVVQAAWTLVFPVSHTSLMMLMALIATALAFQVYSAAAWAGIAHIVSVTAAVLLLIIPAIVEQYSMVMSDILSAVTLFGAAVAFASYLHKQRLRESFIFGIWAVLAIYTRSSGLLLVLIPPIAFTLGRKWVLALRPATWIPAVMVLVLCGPWQFIMAKGASGNFGAEFGPAFMANAAWLYPYMVCRALGSIVIALSILGLYARVFIPLREGYPVEPIWATSVALGLSVWLFHIVVPAGIEIRYILAAFPPLLMFTAAGLLMVVNWARPRSTKAQFAAAAACIILLQGVHVATVGRPPAQATGLGELARALVDKEQPGTRMLIASNVIGEGAFVAAAAMADTRPNHYILRGSKYLAEVDWNGRSYRTTLTSPYEVRKRLAELGVSVIVFFDPPQSQAHNHLLKLAVEESPAEWYQLDIPAARCKDCIVYRARNPVDTSKPLYLDVSPLIRRPNLDPLLR